jgi:hypothetical protein
MSELYIQIALGMITIVGAVYAVRMEAKSRLDSLNQSVIGLQDRKIKLLTDQLGAANKRITELEATVKVLTERRASRSRRAAVPQEENVA